MTDETFTAKLTELLASLRSLPDHQRRALQPLVEQTRQRQADLQANREQALAALDDWRLALKYALFDREATHREHGQ